MALVEVEQLTKVFPGGVVAVDGIDVDVTEGEIFGFLGPNGAGKTTTIRILVTLLAPTSGRVTVDGVSVTDHPERVRSRIGYAAQFIGIDADLTARENLMLQARLHGVDRLTARRRADELLEVLQLTEAAERRAGTFSGGMRRRLDLAQALVHDPRLLFLDEPTTGLDPQTRRALWDYLRGLNDQGVTVFLTTQYLEEADSLADRLAIVDRGRIVVSGTPGHLKSQLGGDTVTVAVAEGHRGQAEPVLVGFSDSGEVEAGGPDELRFSVAGGASRLASIVRALDEVGVPVVRLEVAEPTLDDVFLRHTGSTMAVEEVAPPSRIRLGARRR